MHRGQVIQGSPHVVAKTATVPNRSSEGGWSNKQGTSIQWHAQQSLKREIELYALNSPICKARYAKSGRSCKVCPGCHSLHESKRIPCRLCLPMQKTSTTADATGFLWEGGSRGAFSYLLFHHIVHLLPMGLNVHFFFFLAKSIIVSIY